ncbi:hypothetical protein B0H34DRAFT_767583 [Crassisporium funariophilum]|nr:hypothetical protein B0H34DRAFT_767583 [Crassisporium funariophilum]
MEIKLIPAAHPFDNPDADVILRSSDKEPVDFRVFKLLLTLSSPFFSEIFTLPQPIGSPSPYSHECQDSKNVPVIQMTEDTDTLRFLLALCLPVSVCKLPYFTCLEELHKVIEAAFKFEMEGLQKHLRAELITLRFIESQPMRVFAIAYRYGWDEEAKKAARYALRHPMNGPFFPELGYISGATYYRLQEYHRMCGEVASSRASLQPALAEHDDCWTWITCKRCPGALSKDRDAPEVRQWWVQWIEEVAEELRTRPWGETVKKWDLHRKALQRADSCQNCGKRGRDDLETFSLMLAVDIERDIASVDLDLNPDDWSNASPT